MVIRSLGTALAAGTACAAALAAPVWAANTADTAKTVYVATLHSMNSNVTGHATTGEARFTVQGDKLTIRIRVHGAPPNIEHWQHFHGFKDGSVATCPTAAADANHDGIIDLIEAGPASGTTMVPFNADPAAMQVPSNTYPKASANGSYTYKETVSLDALTDAFAKAFGTRDLDLDHRVIFIHGVPADKTLPASVASLGTIPAQVTLPIACGKIVKDRPAARRP